MPVNLAPPAKLLPIAGLGLAVAQAAIKRRDHADVALISLAEGSTVAATFTRNAFAAAPVIVAREHLQHGSLRALLVNSGNANAGTGAQGIADARACCDAAAEALGLESTQVLPFSTGVIGQLLPVDRVQNAARQAATQRQADAWLAGAQAIMTTDTVAKGGSRTVELGDGETITLTGIAKGSGMIRPDMATMLAFVATDAKISQPDLQASLADAVELSFNSITVDGDTSTNDACVLCATGQARELTAGDEHWSAFKQALQELLMELAQAIVRDAEGATKFISIQVRGAASRGEARDVAFTVAHSPLVKTACFASDPNWGRILAAVGRAGVENLDISKVGITLDDVQLVAGGEPAPDYREAAGAAVMAKPEFSIGITLDRGEEDAEIWTSDLSYDYVKINAEYRT